METKHDILVQNKREVQFKLSINRKFTIIRGDSATGKTTLFQMVSDASSSRTTGVNISCGVPVIALYETGYKYELENESGKIYVIDEDFSALRTKEFATLALKSDNCFIIITRESMPSIPYSYKEIYQIKTSGKFHSLERIYPDYEQFEERERIITEDEDSGFEYYQHFYGKKVDTSHGNSNLSKYGSVISILIGDGCAIGAYIQDLELTGAALFLPESFEWTLLNNGMFQNDKRVSELMEYPERAINTREMSIEKYCTTLLTEITQNTPAQYSKSKINDCYINQCCCKGTKCEFFVRNKKLPY
jgi:hypothetical protein